MNNDEFDIADWSVLFPGDGSGVYSGTFTVYDNDGGPGEQVADITMDRIASVDAVNVGYGDYAETDIEMLVELTDGSWAACMASCDTTGWDCQAGAQWKWGATRDDVIRQGLDRESRRALGLMLDGES